MLIGAGKFPFWRNDLQGFAGKADDLGKSACGCEAGCQADKDTMDMWSQQFNSPKK